LEKQDVHNKNDTDFTNAAVFGTLQNASDILFPYANYAFAQLGAALCDCVVEKQPRSWESTIRNVFDFAAE
jgi:hypothetical protein